VIVRDAAGHERRFDQLILATHADQALAILGQDASAEERRILGAFRYQENRAVLHRARPYDYSQPRTMFHTRIAGDPRSDLAETVPTSA